MSGHVHAHLYRVALRRPRRGAYALDVPDLLTGSIRTRNIGITDNVRLDCEMSPLEAAPKPGHAPTTVVLRVLTLEFCAYMNRDEVSPPTCALH